MRNANKIYVFITIFVVILLLFTLLHGSVLTKEIEYNKTVRTQEKVVVHNPGKSGLLISDSDNDVGDSNTQKVYQTKTIIVKENVSLLSYWLRNLE